jgi:glycosyltransferase involved in cell wall biosynthesis
MCEALVQLGHEVTLFARSDNSITINNNEYLDNFYGVNSDGIELNIFFTKSAKGIELLISIRAFVEFILNSLKKSAPDLIISRNIYAALLCGIVLRNKIIYETHSTECGFRKMMQRWLLNSEKICTVVISKALKNSICKFHGIDGKNIHIFHDAARSGGLQLSSIQCKDLRSSLLGHTIDLERYKKFVGYFGHLYSGRGIEVIQGVARKNKEYAFIVYGGNENEIKQYIKGNNISNLFFMGHISPNLVRGAMSMMNVLLMPYQKNVSIGLDGVDTAKWMSPMKMFEYMSSSVPIISSDLPVLREILVSGDNSILVKADDIDAWSNALQSIIDNPLLAKSLGNNSYHQYKSKYTWNIRVKNMINLCNADAT